MPLERQTPIPTEIMGHLKSYSRRELYEKLEEAGALVPHYTFFKLVYMLRVGRCFRFEQNMLEKAGLWRS